MAAEDQGIMSLPMEGQAADQSMPEMPLQESYSAVSQGLQNASPQAAADIQQLMAGITPQLDQLSDEELAAFLEAIQYLYEGGEQEYAKRLQQVIASGLLDEGDLPEEYDPEVLSAIGTVLLQAQREREGAQVAEPPVQQFARGGIAEAARLVASKGRNGDTMLAHITKDEAKLLKKRGGSGTINPQTGLPEYFLKKAVKAVTGAVKSVVKGVVNAVKSVVKSPIGRVLATAALATFLGPGAMGITGLKLGAAALPIAAGTVTALGGGNLKQVLTSAATAYFGAPGGAVSQYVGAAGITNAAANAAISAGIVGTGAGLLTGQKLSDAVKSGLTAGAIGGLATGVTQGFGTQIPGQPANMAPVSDAAVRPVEQVLTPGDVSQQVAGGAPAVAQAAPAAPAASSTFTPGMPADYQADFYRSIGIEPGSVSGPNMGPTPSNVQIERGMLNMTGPLDTVRQMTQGSFDAAKDFYQKNISPSGIQEAAIPNAQSAGAKAVSDLVARMPDATPAMKEAAYQSAYKAAMPGIIGTYGPAVGAGMGIMALAGGFKPSSVPQSELAQNLRGTPGTDIMNRNPSQYLVQGLPGVQYNEQGNIIGSTAWAPSATMADVRVATPNYSARGAAPTGGIANLFAPQAPSIYAPGPGTMGLAQGIAQPGNTAGMYGNLMPRYTGYNPYGYFAAAEGGLASLARGGYPRKTGAISGPGTETSDSIPAMLSDGEFVMTAKAVKGIGGGSRREGAKKMYALMHQLERNASRG